jgi:hypothetical protein
LTKPKKQTSVSILAQQHTLSALCIFKRYPARQRKLGMLRGEEEDENQPRATSKGTDLQIYQFALFI